MPANNGPVTLRMASPYSDEDRRYTPAVFHFVDKVEELSDGNLRIEMVYRFEETGRSEFSTMPDGEQQVVEAVTAGDVELAWAGTRVFDTFGINGLAALHAPLLVDSYALQAAIIDSDIDEDMLTELEEIGLTGLAVLAGGLRKPIGVTGPLLSPDDFAGITFQLYRSNTQAATVAALGATPIDVVGPIRDQALALGDIDGYEHTLRNYVVREQASLSPYVTANVNLWAETTVLLANPNALGDLSADQVGWLQEAAADAAAASPGLHNNDVDADYVAQACDQGARFANADEAELVSIRDAVAPVFSELEDDARTGAFIDRIAQLKATVAAEPLTIPDGCTGVSPNVVVSASAGAPEDPSVINGIYRFDWTVDELVEAGTPRDVVDQFNLGGEHTWTFEDGAHAWAGQGPEPCRTTYTISGSIVDIHPNETCAVFRITATWRLTDDALVLSDVRIDWRPNEAAQIFLSKPLVRVE